MENSLDNIISLHFFSVFGEYFIGISIIYMVIVFTLIIYNSFDLLLQKSISECVSLILFMTCYLMINDDLVMLDFLSFNSSLIHDYFSFVAKVLICFFSGLYFLFISDCLKEQKLISFEYLLTIMFAVLGLMFMCVSNDLLISYLSIELSSLSFYMLASYKKSSMYSLESGIKYFITGAVSSAFFLLGSSFIYGISGSITFCDFYGLFGYSVLISEVTLFDFNFVELGLTLILFSLFIKLSLAPFHLWSLDVYEGSPTSTTIFFAVISKVSIFVLLIRLCYSSFFSIKDCWQYYFLWVGLFSVFIGSFGGLKQRKLKTLMAYSSVNHMGYVLISMSSISYYGVQMVLFYMIIYMISGLSIWSIFLFLRLKQKYSRTKYSKELGDFVLLKKSNSFISFSLALTMFSLAGIPPLVGFLAKSSLFFQLVNSSFYIIALVSVLCSVVSTFYYIRIIKILYFENLLVGKLYYPINSKKTIILSFLIFALIFFFLNPTLLYLICLKVIFSLFLV